MASAPYSSLLNLLSSFVDSKKAGEVLMRQLSACKLNADTLTNEEIKGISPRLATAFSLYVSNEAKKDELKGKLASF